jgi:hypothetical protein
MLFSPLEQFDVIILTPPIVVGSLDFSVTNVMLPILLVNLVYLA